MSLLDLQIKDGVARLVINRPEARNAMTRAMWADLVSMLQQLADDDRARCVVLTGTDPAFCAGGDVKAMVDRLDGKHALTQDEEAVLIRGFMDASRLLHEMPKPTLAVVNGACAGAGFSLAMACDLRMASSTAKFTTAFARVATSGDFGGSWFLSRIIGTAKARELYYLARTFTGAEAAEMGVVNRAVAPEELDSEAAQWAIKLAEGPSIALGLMKSNFNLAECAPLSEALDQEALNMARTFQTEDHAEAARAFVEKRTSKFEGK